MASVLINIAIGVAANLLIGALTPKPSSVTGKIDDLAPPKANADEPIPLVLGASRVQGTYIWAQPKKETIVNNQAIYRGNFAVILCQGEIKAIVRVWINGKLVYSIARQEVDETVRKSQNFEQYARFYLGTQDQPQDPLMVAAEGEAFCPAYRGRAYIVFENLELPDGQWPNITAEVINGNARLDGTGRVIYDPMPYSDAILKVCQQAGLRSTDLDLSALPSTKSFYGAGFASAGQEYREIIEQLCLAGQIVQRQSGGKLKFNAHPLSEVAIVPAEDLSFGERSPSEGLQVLRKETDTDPSQIFLTSPDPTINYAVGSAYSKITSNSAGQKIISRVQLPVAQLPTERRKLVDILLHGQLYRNREFSFVLPPKYLALEVGDVIVVQGEKVLLTKVNRGANYLMQCEAVPYDDKIYYHVTRGHTERCEEVTNRDGGISWYLSRRLIDSVTTVTKVAGEVRLTPGTDYGVDIGAGLIWRISNAFASGDLLRICYIDDDDSLPPAANTPTTKRGRAYYLDIPVPWDSWGGTWANTINSSTGLVLAFYENDLNPKAPGNINLQHSADNGSTWSALAGWPNLDDSSVGKLIEPLGSWGSESAKWTASTTKDTTNVIKLKLVNSLNSFSSCTPAQIQTGQNMILVGNELIQFETATLISADGTYHLSNLWRGRRATEHATFEIKPINTRAIGIPTNPNDQSVVRVIPSIDTTNLRRSLTLRFGDDGTLIDSAAAQADRFTLNNFQRLMSRPFAPINIYARVDASGNVNVYWARRDRLIGNAGLVADNAGNSEDRWEFVVEFANQSGIVLKSITVTSGLSTVYYRNQIDSDFGAGQSPYWISVYQVGRYNRRSLPQTVKYTDALSF